MKRLALVLLAAACGSKSSPATTGPGNQTGAGGAPEVPPPEPGHAEALDALYQLVYGEPETDPAALVAEFPDGTLVHYVHGCALMREGDAAGASAELAWLAERQADALYQLEHDAEDCGWTDEQRALAAGVTPSPGRAAIDAMLKAFASGDRSVAAPHFTQMVESTTICSLCDPEMEDGGDTPEARPGAEVLDELMRGAAISNDESWDGTYGTPLSYYERVLCAGDCCDFDVRELAHNHDFLSKVCVAHGTETVVTVETIDGG